VGTGDPAWKEAADRVRVPERAVVSGGRTMLAIEAVESVLSGSRHSAWAGIVISDASSARGGRHSGVGWGDTNSLSVACLAVFTAVEGLHHERSYDGDVGLLVTYSAERRECKGQLRHSSSQVGFPERATVQ
jgi:hypothetical protein